MTVRSLGSPAYSATAPHRRRSARRRPAWATAVAAVVAITGWQACAQDGWNPFDEQRGVVTPGARRPAKPGTEPQRPPLAPMDGMRSAPGGLPPPAGQPGSDDAPSGGFALREAVEKTDLAPLAGPEANLDANPDARSDGRSGGSGDPVELARRFSGLPLASKSPALTQLVLRVVGAERPPVGTAAAELAIRAEFLYRSGRIGEAFALVSGRAPGEPEPLLSSVVARLALANGDRERACREAQSGLQAREELPKSLRAEAIAIQGYCGAAQGNASAASLAAGLARENGGLSADTSNALDAVGVGEPPQLSAMRRIGVLDWRLAELAGTIAPATVPLDRVEPALLAVLASSATAPPALRLAAAEAASRINAIDAGVLLEAYRQQTFTPAELAQALTIRVAPESRRALLVRAADAERTPFKRTRLVRAALDDAKRNGLYVAVAAALARTVEDIQPVAEIGWFSETAVEVMLAAGRFDAARRWAQTGTGTGTGIGTDGDRGGSGALTHWLALIDIADPALRGRRGESLAPVEELALRGRFTPEGLHRLATVLDALDYHVPVRLWEAASRNPQPASGHLPATGVLSELQDAAKRKDLVKTAVLVSQALGADGPEGAHMIALGDTIRALRRAGLEREARAVAAESLFALWPRAING